MEKKERKREIKFHFGDSQLEMYRSERSLCLSAQGYYMIKNKQIPQCTAAPFEPMIVIFFLIREIN